MVNSVEFIMKVTFALMVWILFLSTVLYTQENAKTREVVKGIKSDNELIMEKLSKVESQNDSLEKNILNKISQSENLIKSKLDKQKEVIDYLLPILTALLAGLFAIRQVKMNSIASYKIRWVETLRKIISDYISKIDETNTILSNMVDDVKTAARELKIEIDDDQIFSSSKIQAIEERYYKSISEHFSIANNFALQIKLHLNPEKNKKHEKLEQDLDNYATSSVQNFRSWSDINKIERLSQSIIMQSRTILNDEINKVVKKWILF